MWNIFGNKKTKRIKEIAKTFKAMETARDSGMIEYKVKTQQCLIAFPLARTMLASRKRWTRFLNNVFLWQSYLLQQEAWNLKMTHAERDAIELAREENPGLTKLEMERVRSMARESVAFDTSNIPPIKPFDVCIFMDADDENGMPIIVACGDYDPETDRFSLVPWSEVIKEVTLKEQ